MIKSMISANKKENIKVSFQISEKNKRKKKTTNLYTNHWKKPSGFFLNHSYSKAEGSQPRVSAWPMFL